MSAISREQLETQLERAAQRCEQLRHETLYDKEVRYQLYLNYDDQRRECETALRLYGEGRLGICQRCGRSIDPERLKALQNTQFCVACELQVHPPRPRRR